MKVFGDMIVITFVISGLQILEIIKKNVTKQFLSSEQALSNIRKSALDSFYNYTGDTHDFDFLERFRNRLAKIKEKSIIGLSYT